MCQAVCYLSTIVTLLAFPKEMEQDQLAVPLVSSQVTAGASKKKTSLSLVASLVIRSGMSLALHLLIVRAVSGQGNLEPCNDVACLYYVVRSRPQQPSSHYRFATVQNGYGFNYSHRMSAMGYVAQIPTTMWCHSIGSSDPNCTQDNQSVIEFEDEMERMYVLPMANRTPTEVQQMCNAHTMRNRIVNDIPHQMSMWFLLGALVCQSFIDFVHDLLLLKDFPEKRVGFISISSFTCNCMISVQAIFWGMTLSETFVAKDAESGISCFYSFPVIGMLTGVASVAKLALHPFLRLPHLLRALHYGDYLYNFDSYKLPFAFFRTNAAKGTVTDVSSSLLVPHWVGSSATAPVPLPDHRRTPSTAESDATNSKAPFLHMDRNLPPMGGIWRNNRAQLVVQLYLLWCFLVAALGLNQNYGGGLSNALPSNNYFAIDAFTSFATLAATVGTLGTRPDFASLIAAYCFAAPFWKLLSCYFHFLGIETAFQTAFRRQNLHKHVNETNAAMSLFLGPEAQQFIFMISSWAAIGMMICSTPIMARGWFLVLTYAPWLGSAIPTPDGACRLASDGQCLLLIALGLLQWYYLHGFYTYKRTLFKELEDDWAPGFYQVCSPAKVRGLDLSTINETDSETEETGQGEMVPVGTIVHVSEVKEVAGKLLGAIATPNPGWIDIYTKSVVYATKKVYMPHWKMAHDEI